MLNTKCFPRYDLGELEFARLLNQLKSFFVFFSQTKLYCQTSITRSAKGRAKKRSVLVLICLVRVCLMRDILLGPGACPQLFLTRPAPTKHSLVYLVSSFFGCLLRAAGDFRPRVAFKKRKKTNSASKPPNTPGSRIVTPAVKYTAMMCMSCVIYSRPQM